MKSPSYLLISICAFVGRSAAVGVVGTPPGFAASTTGGGSATPQYPADIAELKTWLTDSVARVIVLDKE
jgi:pectin lyase